MEIEEPCYAVNFDLTCGLRLMRYDNERELDRFEMFKAAIKVGISELFSTKPQGEDGDDDEPPELSEDDIL